MRKGLFRARLIAWLTAIGGILILLSTLPILTRRLNRISSVMAPFGVRVTSHVLSVLIGLLLLYLAGQLARRKHLAWLITVVLFAMSVVFNLTRAHYAAAGFSLLMVGLLLFSRNEFRAPGDPPTLFEFLRFVPSYLAAVVVYGLVAIWLERNSISPTPTLGGSLAAIFAGLIGLDGPYTYERRFFSIVFPASLLALGIGGLLAALVLLFRPIVARPQQGDDDWEHANRLIHAYGADTLAYFALRDDKLFFFASDGEAMIAYTYIGRYALASGDPIGRPESIELVVDEFLSMCRRRAWGVALLAVREADRDLYLSRGLHTFYLGDEAIVHCEGFDLKGRKWKSIRQSSGRVERTYRFEFVSETDVSPEMLARLNAISHKWRGKAPERGFTMTLSQDVEGHNPEFRLCMALDEHDEPGGFLRIVPTFGDEPGYTLDLMRRDPDTPNGMTEFLLTRTVMHLDQLGYKRLSMNFAAWGRLFSEDIEYSLRQRMFKKVLDLLSPFYQIKSLKEFNQRFYPEWLPRVIVYDDVRALPRVGLLYGGVEGFLNIPVIGRYLLPRTVAPRDMVPRVLASATDEDGSGPSTPPTR